MDCWFRRCEICQEFFIIVDICDSSAEVFYETWGKVLDEGYHHTMKVKKHCSLKQLIKLFFQTLPAYMDHVSVMK